MILGGGEGDAIKEKTEQTCKTLSGTVDSQRDSRESIRATHSQLKPLFLYRVRPSEADSPESLEFPIRANHATKVGKVGDRREGVG